MTRSARLRADDTEDAQTEHAYHREPDGCPHERAGGDSRRRRLPGAGALRGILGFDGIGSDHVTLFAACRHSSRQACQNLPLAR